MIFFFFFSFCLGFTFPYFLTVQYLAFALSGLSFFNSYDLTNSLINIR